MIKFQERSSKNHVIHVNFIHVIRLMLPNILQSCQIAVHQYSFMNIGSNMRAKVGNGARFCLSKFGGLRLCHVSSRSMNWNVIGHLSRFRKLQKHGSAKPRFNNELGYRSFVAFVVFILQQTISCCTTQTACLSPYVISSPHACLGHM